MIRNNNNIQRGFVLILLVSLLTVMSTTARNFTLVIDAGHGGHDAGARGSFSYEKDINLRTALAFGRYVEKNCPDVKVIYTRKTDVFIPLHKRADIANKNGADVFISIHTNALPAGRVARGLETYTMGMRRSNEKLSAAQRENAVITYESDYKQRYEGYDPNSPESAIMFEFIHDKNMAKSVELARLIQKNVCSTASRPDKGVKQDVFLVLRETSMPACLVELGFITTPDEEKLLNDESSVDNIARGIYNAFAKYKNDNFTGFTVPYEAANDNKVKIPTIVPKDDNEQEESSQNKKVVAKAPAPKTRTVQRVKTQVNVEKKKEAESIDIKNVVAEPKHADADEDKPVFKVQVVASSIKIPSTSSRFKGHKDIDSYNENGMFKYTIGSSLNYNEINRLRISLTDAFPGCFVVAFKNGEKMNINEAIREFRRSKK